MDLLLRLAIQQRQAASSPLYSASSNASAMVAICSTCTDSRISPCSAMSVAHKTAFGVQSIQLPTQANARGILWSHLCAVQAGFIFLLWQRVLPFLPEHFTTSHTISQLLFSRTMILHFTTPFLCVILYANKCSYIFFKGRFFLCV